MIKIGINGFGRIGRLVLRAALERQRENFKIVSINDLGSLQQNYHLLNFDSVHGKLNFKSTIENNNLVIDEDKISFYNQRSPENIPWEENEVDIVLECTGLFTDADSAKKHLSKGVKKVLISAPSNNAEITGVFGVNSNLISDRHDIISNASCTTNCLAPVAKILNDNFGIEAGFMTTVHSFTSDQKIIDGLHKDARRGRTASISMIPTSTGAAKAVGLVLPELEGKLDGTAIRIPTPNVSMIDFTFQSKEIINKDDINKVIKKESSDKLKNILEYNDLPLVSIDYNHNSSSSIFDSTQTQTVGDHFGRVLSWYDNEWGFSNRMIDVAKKIGDFI